MLCYVWWCLILLNRVILFYVFICTIYQCIELYLFLWQFHCVVLRRVNSLFWKWLPSFLSPPFCTCVVLAAHFLIWTRDQRLQERLAWNGRSLVSLETQPRFLTHLYLFDLLRIYTLIKPIQEQFRSIFIILFLTSFKYICNVLLSLDFFPHCYFFSSQSRLNFPFLTDYVNLGSGERVLDFKSGRGVFIMIFSYFYW